MTKLNTELRTRLAQYILLHPKESVVKVAESVGVEVSQARHIIQYTGAETLLKNFGGVYATQERINEVFMYSLRRQKPRKAVSKPAPRTLSEAIIPSVARELLSQAPVLRSHECQWVVSVTKAPFYCRGVVSKLYCEAHDVLAKEAERQRFEKAHTL